MVFCEKTLKITGQMITLSRIFSENHNSPLINISYVSPKISTKRCLFKVLKGLVFFADIGGQSIQFYQFSHSDMHHSVSRMSFFFAKLRKKHLFFTKKRKISRFLNVFLHFLPQKSDHFGAQTVPGFDQLLDT